MRVREARRVRPEVGGRVEGVAADQVWLVVGGLLNSVIGAYYYLRVIVFMYMREPEPGAPIAKPMRSGYVGFALAVAAILVLLLGIFPGSSLDIARAASLGAP